MPHNTVSAGPSIDGPLGDAEDPRKPVDELTRVNDENASLKRRLREIDDQANDAADKERREVKEQDEQAARTQADLERLRAENEQLKADLDAAKSSTSKSKTSKSTPADTSTEPNGVS
ncbi:MAG: hypothetical protein ABW046_22555 [Actinoplanes sp.]